ncbi:MAG: NADH-quinone oxidoreductase subunit NuoE [Burkholderiales bacterium]
MLSSESLIKIDREIAKYPADQKQSAVMSALRIAQQEKGWLSSDTIQFVADYLGMPRIAAYEVATFYNMYHTQPLGKHKLMVCTNLPCRLTWRHDIGAYLQKKLGIGFGETTEDGKYTLIEGECMGACGDAPLMLINNHRMCGFLTPEKVDQLLAELDKP